MKENKYRVTMTESQLRLMAMALDDWHRFVCGDMQMWNATAFLQNRKEVFAGLRNLERVGFPELSNGAAYDWAGNGITNKEHKKAATMSYMLYREVEHYFAKQHPFSGSVLLHPTMLCKDQGPLIKIEEVTE